VTALPKAATGRYQIRVTDLRVATENDLALNEARNLLRGYLNLHRQGRDLEARTKLERCLQIREKILGPNDPQVEEAVSHLAVNYRATGEVAAAESMFLRSLQINEKTYGAGHPNVAVRLSGLGTFYWEDKSDDVKAEEMDLRALAIFQKAQMEETSSFGALLSGLGDIYYARHDYEKAESYYLRSREVFEKVFGPDSFHLAASYSVLGVVAYDMVNYEKAKAMHERALALSEKGLGADSVLITRDLNNLAIVYSTIGDYATAESLFRRALSNHERAGAMSHPAIQQTLLGLARIYAVRGEGDQALKFQSQESDLEERYLALNLKIGSERERQTYLARYASNVSRNISLHVDHFPEDSMARDLAVRTLLQRKGRVQDAMSNTFSTLRNRLAPEDQRLLEQLRDQISRLANAVVRGPEKSSPADYEKQIKALEDEVEKLEERISLRSARSYTRSKPLTLTDVTAAIPEHAALIEFAVYRPWSPKAPESEKAFAEPQYVAYVLRRSGDVQWKRLGSAKAIDEILSRLRDALRNPQRKDVQRLGRVVDEKVLQPIRSLLGNETQILVSPDGQLNLIPFEALVDEHGRYLVERYSFAYLTSGRDLLRLQVPRESKSGPLVLAGPAFGTPPVLASGSSSGSGGARAQFNYSQLFFGPLPGVTAEVSALRELLPDATFLTGEAATEAKLKQVRAPSILHIATHGFFLQNESVDSSVKSSDGSRMGKWIARIDNPLLRSGLALAGANQGRSGEDDGVLTALEASALDLWGTKLVVLSACDTGVGEVKNGDGVYGLRRALFLAGTESQLMSLWAVSDRSTHDLMAQYYKELMHDEGRNEALRRVQLSMLHDKFRRHPYYWASFILTGEWANLKGQR
jgi:CHAT domain-containing protein